MPFDFEQLDAWKLAKEFATRLYQVSKDLPKHELFGMTSQLRRAAISIPANIAEGAGRHSEKEFIRFIRIARGSLYETMTMVSICSDLGYFSDEIYQSLYKDGNRVGQVINGLARGLKKHNC